MPTVFVGIQQKLEFIIPLLGMTFNEINPFSCELNPVVFLCFHFKKMPQTDH